MFKWTFLTYCQHCCASQTSIHLRAGLPCSSWIALTSDHPAHQRLQEAVVWHSTMCPNCRQNFLFRIIGPTTALSSDMFIHRFVSKDWLINAGKTFNVDSVKIHHSFIFLTATFCFYSWRREVELQRSKSSGITESSAIANVLVSPPGDWRMTVSCRYFKPCSCACFHVWKVYASASPVRQARLSYGDIMIAACSIVRPSVRSSVTKLVNTTGLSLILTRGQSNLTKSASRGPIPRLGVTPGGRNLYHWIPGVGFPISVP